MSADPSETPTQDASPGRREMLFIERTWLVSAAVGLVTFLIGGLLGYFLALTAYQRGIDDTRVAVQQALANLPAAPAGGQTADQPTPLPERLDSVSEGDSPAKGPEDAPIVLIEFSDFR
jgi:hypothetical protein